MRNRRNCFRGLVMLSLFLLIFLSPFANMLYVHADGPNVPNFPDYKAPNLPEYPEYTPPNVPELPEYTPPNVPDSPEGKQPNDASDPNDRNNPGEGSPNNGDGPGDGSPNDGNSPGDGSSNGGSNPGDGSSNGGSNPGEGSPNGGNGSGDGSSGEGNDAGDGSTNNGNTPGNGSGNEGNNGNNNSANGGDNPSAAENNPSAYDYAMFGATGLNSYVGFHADMMETTGLDPKKAPGSVGRSFGRNVVMGIGLNAMNLGLQNTVGGDVADGISDLGEAGYNAYDVNSLRNQSNTIRTMETGASKPASMASSASNIAKNPLVKLGSRLNVGTAVVGGAISAVDYGKNVVTAFNQNNSYEERSAAVIDGVGDAGSVLMSAGVVAGASGAGAPVGLALAGAGAVLWGGSKLAKWGDKLTGGKISGGITKGLKAVDAGVNKVKDVASKAAGKVKSFFGF